MHLASSYWIMVSIRIGLSNGQALYFRASCFRELISFRCPDGYTDRKLHPSKS